MKIRVQIPDEYLRSQERCQEYIDDILFWGLETGMDIEFYTFYREPKQHWNDHRRWAIFSVETDYAFMFSLKWGAVLHKGKKVTE